MKIPTLRTLHRYFQSSWEVKMLAIKVWIALGSGRARVCFTSFKSIAEKMGESQKETPTESWQDPVYLSQLNKVINSMSRFTPWKSNCFAQALAANQLLKKKEIPHTIYFGVMHSKDGKLKAHAWLRAGDKIVTGSYGHQAYTVTGIFGYLGK
ncbi:MAG: lasso peptide biosynthesis B2 protein [Cytophagales bacterium]|nr:lasso peptide biosynthesis B2 protein [Cytophagales bacterium]